MKGSWAVLAALAFGAAIFWRSRFAVAACAAPSLNRRKIEDILPLFNELTDKNFVGQEVAIQNIRAALHDYVLHHGENGNGATILHLVGPSGTGKSYLSELIANSLFDDCASLVDDIRGGVRYAGRILGNNLKYISPSLNSFFTSWGDFRIIDWLTNRRCDETSRLEDYRQSCGIVYASFHNQGQNEAETNDFSNAAIMQNFLEVAARELIYEPHSVLILDDFNFCDSKCGSLLKQLVTTQTISTRNGVAASASNALIVLTSDLTNFGLMLRQSETYQSSLVLVRKAAEAYWGELSPFIINSEFIPFSPLSDLQIGQILDRIVHRMGAVVRRRIELMLRKNEAEGKGGSDVVWEWQGRFYIEESTKLSIIDRLQIQIEAINARAVTETFKSKLWYAIRHPGAESLLQDFKLRGKTMYSNEDIVVKLRRRGARYSDFELSLVIR